MNTHSNTLVPILVRLLVLIVIAKAVGTFAYILLPKEGVGLQNRFEYSANYVRVDFSKLLKSSKGALHDTQAPSHNASTIGELLLKGLYGNEHFGYVVIARKSQPQKTSIIALGEEFEGYRLRMVGLNYALFEKNGKSYRLHLAQTKPLPKSTAEQSTEGSAQTQEVRVAKRDIDYFAAHPSAIWKNITIKEIRKNGKIEGFKVMWIRQNSKFAKLGLKKGDIIIKVNNKRLTSYKDAIAAYSNINKQSQLQVVVLRNGVQKELLYEID